VTAALLLAAAITVVGGPGVPDSVSQRARSVVETALGEGDARLELFRTAAEMEAAVRRIDATAHLGDYADYFHRESRTIFAWMAPHADDRLFADRLPGPLLGALVHEVQHARAGDARPVWRAEGEADLATTRFLARTDWVGRGAWAWMLESRIRRARTEKLFAPDEKFRAMSPWSLPAAQRAVWYAQAYALTRGERETDLPWILWQGTADPIERGSFRLYPGAVVVRRHPGPLTFTVTPIIPGDFEIRLGDDEGRIRILVAGGVQAGWGSTAIEWDKVRACPPLGAASRIEFDGRVLRVGGKRVLYVQPLEGRVGFATQAGAFDIKDAS
jgi:hypothetical protein